MTSSMAKDSFYLMIGRGLAFLISVIVPIFLVRVLSVEKYGEYRQLMLIMTTASVLLPFGMPQSLFYFLPNFPEKKAEYISRTIAVYIISGSIFIILIWLFSDKLVDFFKNENFLKYAPTIGFATVFLVCSLLIETILIAEKKVVLSAKVLTVSRTIRAIIIIGFAFFSNVIAIFYGLIVFFIIKFLISLYYLRKIYFISIFKISFQNSLSQLKYSLPIALSGVLYMIIEAADKFIISNNLGTENFAIYATGCYEVPFIIIIFQSIGDVILPRIVSYRRDNNTQQIMKLWHNAIEKSFLFGLPIFTFFYFYAEDIVKLLFTVKYIAAVPIFKISLITILFESTRYGVMSMAYAKTIYASCIAVFACIIMLIACFYGVNHYGMIGAISGVMVGKFFIVTLELLLAKYLLKVNWKVFYPVKNISKMAIFSIVSIGASYCSSILLKHYNIVPVSNITAIIYLSVNFIVFISCYLFITNIFNQWEVDFLPLSDTFKKPLSKIFK